MLLLSLALSAHVMCTNIPSDTLSLNNINKNNIIRNGFEYSVYIDHSMTGYVKMNWEFCDMNKRYNWNYIESFNIDLSLAQPLFISNEMMNKSKQQSYTLSNQKKSDYQHVYFKQITNTSALFGNDIDAGKIKVNSILITCITGNETLFIFQSYNNNWYYISVIN